MGGMFIADLFGGGSPDYAGEAERAEAQRQARIKSGLGEIDTAFSGFTPTFYDQRANAYTNAGLPQLATQYQTNRKAIIQNLANRGLLRSSSALKQGSALQKAAEIGKQSIAETGRSQAQDLQRQVEDRRNALIGQVNQSADPAGAKASAITSASSFRQPSVLAPIANMFSGVADAYLTSNLINQYRQPVTSGIAPSYYDINTSALGGKPVTSSTY